MSTVSVCKILVSQAMLKVKEFCWLPTASHFIQPLLSLAISAVARILSRIFSQSQGLETCYSNFQNEGWDSQEVNFYRQD